MNDKAASSSSDDPIVLRRQIEALEARVEAASQVEKQLARLASLPERNPDPVIETDLDGQIIYLNPVARERFPDLEEAGSTHPLLRDLPTIIRSLQEGDQDSHLCELTLEDYIYELKTTYVAESGLVRIYAHDISERIRAERALRASEDRFYTIFEYSNDAIFLIDPQADEILDCNSKACRMLGYEREQLIALAISAIHPNEMDKLKIFAQSVFDQGGGWTDELTCQTHSGQVLAVEMSASLAEIEGRTCIISLVRDSTEHERAQQLLADEVKAKYNYEEIIGQSSSLKQVLEQVELVAPTDASVLILGETGTGKELICRALHHTSPRRDEHLVKLNCASIPSGLIESELFGHEKGAFTGAIAQKRGRFELAHNGTLFLDEIGDLPLDTQPKLLRLLQEKEFERVGGNRTIDVDVRVIAATHRNLEAMVREGVFREDLFYRLNVFPIALPSLRQRPEDIPALAAFFANRACTRLGRPSNTFSPTALERLQNYPWPGNVRELENIVERAVILAGGQIIDTVHVQVEADRTVASIVRPLKDMEYDHIVTALRATNGKVSGKGGAAELLGLKPTTLDSRIKKLGIDPRNLGF